jgi:hypothetical protein
MAGRSVLFLLVAVAMVAAAGAVAPQAAWGQSIQDGKLTLHDASIPADGSTVTYSRGELNATIEYRIEGTWSIGGDEKQTLVGLTPTRTLSKGAVPVRYTVRFYRRVTTSYRGVVRAVSPWVPIRVSPRAARAVGVVNVP